MLNQLIEVSGGWLTLSLVSFTIALFFIFSVREFSSMANMSRQLKDIGNIKENAQSNIIDTNSLSKEQLIWVTDHLVYTPCNEGLAIESNQQFWASKSPISQMLPNFDTSRYKLIPALLTSIGITGTFLGITFGLSEFSMAGDSNALLKSAAELLEGMKTAFYTSLAGLGTSALFMVWMKISSSVVARAQKQLIDVLSSQYFEVSPIYYLKNMSNEGQKGVIEAQLRSAKAMESMGENMNATTKSLADLGSSFNGDIIAERLSTALTDSIESTMTPALNGIKHELATLKDIKEQSQKELVDLLIREMRTELIEPVTVELNKTSEAVSKSNDIAGQLNSNVERVVTSTSQTVDTINQFQKETMTKLQAFAESLKDILNSFKQDTEGAMTSIATEVQDMLKNASKGMDQQRTAFEQSAHRASGAFVDMKASLESALDKRQSAENALFENVTGRINSLLSDISTSFDKQTSVIETTGQAAASLMNQAQIDFETSVQQRREEESKLFGEMEGRIGSLVTNAQSIFKEQAGAIKLVGDEASGVMQTARTELQQGLGDIDSKVKSMSETVQRELEAFRLQYQQNLTAYFEQQNNILENSLSKQRNGLNQVVDNFRNVFESEYKARHNLLQELSAQYAKLEASAATLERVAKAIGLNEASKMAELQDAAHTMSREIASLKKEYAQASATFADVTENLPKAMDDYFTRANESFESFFKDFDQSASAIHNKLSQAAGYLINAQVQRREFEADEVSA